MGSIAVTPPSAWRGRDERMGVEGNGGVAVAVGKDGSIIIGVTKVDTSRSRLLLLLSQ